MNLAAYLAIYPPAPPRISPANPDEFRRLGAGDGVLAVNAPPFPPTTRSHPNGAQADQARHLWVFLPGPAAPGIPAIVEVAPVTPPLQSGIVKHTNLTGGNPASCGGELWVDPTSDRIFVNGASGRYGPTTARQLDDAVSVFEDLGYPVTSFGWDHDTNRPARWLRA